MPKILCLHGHGTSAAIFKSQTAAFRAKLGPDFVFDFVDAPFPSRGAPGINAIYKSATYTWWPQPTPQAIRDAHSWVTEYARQNGKFDAVCCFSQGCSLAASMALYEAVEAAASSTNGLKPEERLPFRAAIFICGGIPLQVLDDIGLEVPIDAHEIRNRAGQQLNKTAGRLNELAANLKLIKPGVGLWDDNELMHDPRARPEPSEVFGLDFTRFPSSARIRMPTLHIYGSKDPMWPASIQLAEFCDMSKREYDHGGGHDIPRTTEVSNRIADMIRELMGDIQVSVPHQTLVRQFE